MGPLPRSGERSRLPLRCQRHRHLLRHLRLAAQPRRRLRRHLSRYPSLRRPFHRHLVETRRGASLGPGSPIAGFGDSGGSNSCTSWAWKTEIQAQVCNAFGFTVTIAHYPTGASKWNPIEHRLFSEISKNWVAEPLDSYEKMLNFIRNTRTQTGLAVTADLDRKKYPIGLKPDPRLISSLRLKAQQHTSEMELHHCAESVKLILRRPLARSAARSSATLRWPAESKWQKSINTYGSFSRTEAASTRSTLYWPATCRMMVL